MKKRALAVRQARMHEMVSRLTLHTLYQGLYVVPLDWGDNLLSVRLGVLKDEEVSTW